MTMNQQDFPRYHEAQKTIAISQNETKYKNMRLMILLTLIFSLVNCVTVLAIDTFYYFSAYLPLVFIATGVNFYVGTGMMIFYVVAVVLALVTLIPYLLAYIFSKKQVGWMIAALVLFSVDTLLLLVDVIVAFSSALLICLLFHVYIIVMLAMGVKYGKLVKQEKEAAQAAAPYADPYAAQMDGAETASTDAIPFECYVGNRPVFSLKNGKSDSFEATGESFVLRAGSSNGMVVGEITVPAGESNLTYELSMKMGMVTNSLVFKEIAPVAPEL